MESERARMRRAVHKQVVETHCARNTRDCIPFWFSFSSAKCCIPRSSYVRNEHEPKWLTTHFVRAFLLISPSENMPNTLADFYCRLAVFSIWTAARLYSRVSLRMFGDVWATISYTTNFKHKYLFRYIFRPIEARKIFEHFFFGSGLGQ